MKDIMLHPDPWGGIATNCSIKNMEWIKELGNRTWCNLWLRWPLVQNINLPKDYDLYIVSFHLEAVDVPWLWQQAETIDSPIIVLTESIAYDCPLPANVKLYQFYWWHQQLELIQKWHPNKIEKQLAHQFSAICNRITQSKLLITTMLLELDTKSIIKLSTWKSIDADIKTGNKKLDKLHDTFYNKWFGTTIDLPDTHITFKNHQYHTSDPWGDIYQKCALHFTNESFHYSYIDDEHGHYIYPGPFITEKTLKCLVGATGFIPVGQFETYKALTDVGFKLDYDFNTDFDNDKGNISRLESIVNLIEELSTWTQEDLFEATKDSSNYNQEYIYSQEFYKFCKNKNQKIIKDILDKNI